ncbi:MAG: ATP-binding protein [Actinomycetota bacterium]
MIIWLPFYTANPWRLSGPVAAVLWAAAVVAYLCRRWPVWQLAVLDSGVYMVLALSAGWCVPMAVRGQAASWLFIAMASQLIVLAWFTPAVVSAPVAVAVGAAYAGGTMLIQEPVPRGSGPGASGFLLIVTASIHLSGRQLLYRRASKADTALAAADREAQDQYVVLSRNIERREHERMLHDTVLNTLTALARASGCRDEVIARCRHDVTLMEHALGDPGDLATAADRSAADLAAGLEAVATELRAGGLEVHVGVTHTGDGLAIPVAAADAITHAARQALTNVAQHAGTGQAWVDVSLAGPAGAVRVTVRDHGAGFDPGQVDAARLGLRRSITERIADVGGTSSITSGPGKGTVVSLCWPAVAEPLSVRRIVPW